MYNLAVSLIDFFYHFLLSLLSRKLTYYVAICFNKLTFKFLRILIVFDNF